MALEKIPKFDEVKTWAQNQGWITESEAPVQTVDGMTGDVNINNPSLETISGNLVGRSEVIDNLEGNVYLESEGTDPETVLENDGDIVFIHE